MARFDFDHQTSTPFAQGDVANLFLSVVDDGVEKHQVVVKAAITCNDNDLLIREDQTLRRIRARMARVDSMWQHAIPKVYDSFHVKPGEYWSHRVNVLELFSGFFSAHAVRSVNPIDARTLGWVWKRLLILLDWTHQQGFVHGALLPPHILLYPDNNKRSGKDPRKHAIRVVDWCYSTDYTQDQKLPAWCPQWADFYPPEVRAKHDLGPWTDLYMGAKTMVFLAGGNVTANLFPPEVDQRISDCIRKCLELKPEKRAREAKAHFSEFDDVLKDVFGEPKYHDFIMPGI